MYKKDVIKIGKIVGVWYRHEVIAKTVIVYGIGAPIPPDNGTLPDAVVLEKYETDIFVPDYIGYGRSDGIFTPLNCIKTFTQLFSALSKGCEGSSGYLNKKWDLGYQRIIFVGRSFGGTYVPLLPRFNLHIKELAIIYPVVDSKSCGSMPPEESNEDFLRSMVKDGYYHLYRGIDQKIWKTHLENHDDLSPMDNIQYLKNARLFIAHGKKDTVVNYKKSEIYYEKIRNDLPIIQSNIAIRLYKNGDHSFKTSGRAMKDLMRWFKIPKR